MKTEDFDYDLPEELIAQTPLMDRDASRMMVLDKATGEIEDKHFYDIIDYLNSGDTLILNDTKVIPARLYGTKEDTGAVIEMLMLKDKGDDNWECLCRPAKRVKVGTILDFGNKIKAECVETDDEGIRVFKLRYTGILFEILDELGEMPLPPYIHQKLARKDQNMYQTVYAKNEGSAAAPTAGLHFTKELLDKIAQKGINIVYITLHVGLGTFRPVNVDDIKDHKMHSEFYIMSASAAETLSKANKECSGWTDIFIYPGFEFKAIDALITNFHLPKSTLVMLVSALAGREHILNAYKEAVNMKYRFFSFGDAMFIK